MKNEQPPEEERACGEVFPSLGEDAALGLHELHVAVQKRHELGRRRALRQA